MNVIVKSHDDFISVAEVLRQKTDTTERMAFPNDFLNKIKQMKDLFFERGELEDYSNENVFQVPSYAFSGGKLKNFNLPNVKTIGECAFENTLIKEINLPKVEVIGNGAFYGTLVKEVDLPNLQILGNDCFSRNYLEYINIPKILELPSSSFRYYDNLKIFKGESVQYIGSYAFREVDSLREIYFPNVLEIGRCAFQKCNSLTKVDLPKVKTMGDTWAGTGHEYSTFSTCAELLEFSAPELTACGQYLFYNCQKLEKLYLPNLAGSPGSHTLAGCLSLKELTIPKVQSTPWNFLTGCQILSELDLSGVESLLGDGIRNCAVLKKVILKAVNTISEKAISQCPLFDTLIINKTDSVCTLENSNAFPGSKIAQGEGIIYVPDNLVEEYKIATNWSTFVNQIKPISEYILCTNISMNSSLNITNNSPQILTATLTPSNTVEELKWESSDMSVAYVLTDGTVIPKKNGTTIITASCGQAKANCTVTVSNMNNITHTDTLFQLSEGLALNGEEYINTNVQLAKEDIDFTIVGDITLKDGNGQYKTIYHCLESKNDFYAGFMMDVDGADQVRFHTHGTNTILPIPNKIQVSNFKFVVTHIANSQQIKIKYLYNSKITEKVVNINYKSTLKNLYIGACLGDNGVLGRHPKGAIHDFAIMNRVLTTEEINDYLS